MTPCHALTASARGGFHGPTTDIHVAEAPSGAGFTIITVGTRELVVAVYQAA